MLLRADVYEEGDALVVEADLPGVAAREVEVIVDARRVRIRGVRKEAPSARAYHRNERGQGDFEREIPLPREVRSRRAEATLRDGVLRVRMLTVERQPERSPLAIREEG